MPVELTDAGLLIRWELNEAISSSLNNSSFIRPYGLIEFEDDETGAPVLIAGQTARLRNM